MKIDKTTGFAITGMLLILVAVTIIISFRDGATGQAYFDRNMDTPYGPRVIPSNCAYPDWMCKGHGACSGNLMMLYKNGLAQGCVDPNFYAPSCSRTDAFWNGHSCSIYDPNMRERCVCP